MLARQALRAQVGFSLIECMIACIVFATLCLMALPSFTSAIQDAQVRTAAQSLVSSLQLARTEAIRRNASVKVVFKNELGGVFKKGGTDWTIEADNLSNPGTPTYQEFQKRIGLEGTPQARIGARTSIDFAVAAQPGDNLPNAVVFNGLGRLAISPAAPGTAITQIDIVHAHSSTARRLSIALSPGGQIRLCDPVIKRADNPQGCA